MRLSLNTWYIDGMGQTTAQQWLQLLFNGTAISSPSLAMNENTSPLTSLYVALHTADPTTGATTQTSSEVLTGAYSGYARVAVSRASTGAGWSVTANVVNPLSTVSFPACTGGTGATISYWSVGTSSSGASQVLYVGSVSPNIIVSNGVTPQLTTASSITQN